MSATLPALLAARAKSAPGSAALLAPGRSPLTYKSLVEETAAAAAALRSFGIRRNERVALALPPGPECATAFLAVASVAAAAPLNPQYKSAEYEFYLGALRAKALITMEGLEEAERAAQRLGVPVLRLRPKHAAGAFALELPGPLGAAPESPAGADDVALLLHTSGTTARPKLVPLTHANLLASARAVAATLKLSPADRSLCVMPLFHIHGLVAALLAPLASGGCVVVPPGFHALDFFSWLGEFHPTWYSAVPSMHQSILAHAAKHKAEIAAARLRFIRSSSAALPPSVLAMLEKTFSCPVVESYGMTEAAHQMASNPLPPLPRKPGSVGPAAGPEIKILGEGGKFLRPGETGEVVIRGPNVTAGYLDNPDANKASFHDGWFRTGDLGKFDADGYLTLVSRIKEIINRGGEKIAPREIEEVILSHPDVAEAAAFPVPDKSLGEEIGCAVVLKPGAKTTPRSLREFAGRHLAYFKLPRHLLVVDAIPKGATGKVQRANLAKLLKIESAPALASDATPPRTDLEKLLHGLWREVLRAENFGIHVPFLDLGGDSILAAQLVARIRDRLSLPLTLADIWDTPTISAMAARIEERKGALKRPAPTPKRKTAAVLSFSQEWWLGLEDASHNRAASNRPSSLLLEGPLDAAALGRAFAALVARHESLRTSFPKRGGRRVPQMDASARIVLPVRDLSPLPAAKARAAAEAEARLFARVPFDAGIFPLWRARLLRLSPTRHVLAFAVHHAIFDGWSMAVFARDLAVLYEAEATGREAQLPELAATYSGLAAQQRRELSGPDLETLEKFWREALAGLPRPPRLPFARKRPKRPSLSGAAAARVLSKPLAEGLRALGRREGATLYMTALAVFQALLARYTKSTDVLTGCLVAGRDRLESENLIGLFFNAIPMRGDVSGDPTARETIARTGARAQAAFAHAGMPITRLVELLGAQPQAGESPIPLVPVLFQLRSMPPVTGEGAGVRFREFPVENEHARFDLTFDLTETDAGLDCHLAFNADIFDAAAAKKILSDFAALAAAFVASPDAKLSALNAAKKGKR
jgi:acyl-CoA synthetase (AMP-forming)/AMP-acid ligase II/acyl carrier protein